MVLFFYTVKLCSRQKNMLKFKSDLTGLKHCGIAGGLGVGVGSGGGGWGGGGGGQDNSPPRTSFREWQRERLGEMFLLPEKLQTDFYKMSDVRLQKQNVRCQASETKC